MINIYGCKKETSASSETVYFDKHYKSFAFKEKSYWVYKNELSHEIDSIILFKADSGFYWNPPEVHGIAGTRRSFYKMTFESKSFNYEFLDLIDSYGIRRNPTSEWYICGRVIYSIPSQSNVEHFDSLAINGKMFYNITKCKIAANDYPEGCSNAGFTTDTDLYLVEKIGVVKKVVHEVQGNVTWDLIKWKIVM
jgi:hypothetical protein